MKKNSKTNLIPMTKNSQPEKIANQGPNVDQVLVAISKNNRSNENFANMMGDTINALQIRNTELEKENSELKERLSTLPPKK